MSSENNAGDPCPKRQKISAENQNSYDEVTIATWRKGYTSETGDNIDTSDTNRGAPSSKHLPLIDLRSKESYAQHHVKDKRNETLIVHLPFETLLSGERSCELPPRHVEFAILVPSNFDRDQIQDFFFATLSKATSQSRKPWLVRQVIYETEELWDEVKEMGILSSNSRRVSGDDNGNGDDNIDEIEFPLPRLWKPDQMIEDVLHPLLKKEFIKCHSMDLEKHFVVWDLGSGAGRDCSFLAEELKHQIHMTGSNIKLKIVGFDNHKGSARRSLPLWKNRFVDDVCESRLVNLKNMTLLEENIKKEGKIMCMYAIRYLNRRMLEFISSIPLVTKGCIFAMSHFCKGENAEWNWDHPKVSGCLTKFF